MDQTSYKKVEFISSWRTLEYIHMPCEIPVCRPQSFEAPPCARREPLQKPVTIFKAAQT